jgi:hypothetical protein
MEFGWHADGDPGNTFEAIADAVKPDVLFVHSLRSFPEGVERATDYRKVVLVHDHDLWCPTGLGYTRHNRKTCTHTAGLGCYLALAFLERVQQRLLPVKVVNIQKKIRQMARYQHFDTILANSTFIQNKLLASGYPASRMHLCHPVLNQGDPESTPVPDPGDPVCRLADTGKGRGPAAGRAAPSPLPVSPDRGGHGQVAE